MTAPPADPVSLDKTGRPADANSSVSDLKAEIRTSSSSGSGQVITDRWDTAHYTSHRALYDQHSDERAFPPFEKVGKLVRAFILNGFSLIFYRFETV